MTSARFDVELVVQIRIEQLLRDKHLSNMAASFEPPRVQNK